MCAASTIDQDRAAKETLELLHEEARRDIAQITEHFEPTAEHPQHPMANFEKVMVATRVQNRDRSFDCGTHEHGIGPMGSKCKICGAYRFHELK